MKIDPLKSVTKPFYHRLSQISTIFHRLLNHNIEELNLFSVDVSSHFNHFTILLYYSIPSIKPCSKMDWNTDIKYSKKEIYKKGSNSQRDNTQSVVYSVNVLEVYSLEE